MDNSAFVSVICEYNPFHGGHFYQLSQLKKHFGAVVCIMSGDMVQRGELAIAEKYIRAKAALNSGADLVLELPFPYCCSSATDFARSGVYIAEAINSPYIAFGAEDTEEILKIAESIKTDEFLSLVAEITEKNKNYSYPAAFYEAVLKNFGKETAEKMKKPNNILAIEYLKYIKTASPYPIKRESGYLSSSQIRSLGDADEILKNLPAASANVFAEYKNISFPRDAKRLDGYFLGNLRAFSGEGEFYAVTEDLKNKILKAAKTETAVEGVADICKDKIYTAARVRRAIISLVFGIRPNDVCGHPLYTNLLAADEKGQEIIKTAKKSGKIKIITKPSHSAKDENIKTAFAFAERVENILSLSTPKPGADNYPKTPFILTKNGEKE